MGSPARSLNGLINCRETRLILRRYPSQLQGRMRRQTTGRVSNAGRAAPRGATLNTCALPTRQLRHGKHSTPPILNSRSCGARPNKRHTNDQSVNLLSRVWLRNGKNPPMRREALDALARLYRAKNETGKLYDILQRLHESSPNEPPITADLARLGLNIGQNTKESQDLAKEAYDRAPNDTNCAVTYAFSLDRLGHSDQGLEIIKKLPPDQLHDPHAAVYVTLLLLDANQTEAAKEYVDAADDVKIYAEEKNLLDEARAKLATALSSPSPLLSPAPAELSPTPTPTSTP